MAIHVRENNSSTMVNLENMDLNIYTWESHPISLGFWVEYGLDDMFDMFGLHLT